MNIVTKDIAIILNLTRRRIQIRLLMIELSDARLQCLTILHDSFIYSLVTASFFLHFSIIVALQELCQWQSSLIC